MTSAISVYLDDSDTAKKQIRKASPQDLDSVLHRLADLLRKNEKNIIQANQIDMENGKTGQLSNALLDRLMLDSARIQSLADSVDEIAKAPQVLGKVLENREHPNGAQIQKVSIPLGTILMIFESRPNVVIDSAALAIKSGNCVLLKGGKEAFHSNKILGDIVTEACEDVISTKTVQVLPSDKREYIGELLNCPNHIDLVIPRGGKGLVEYVAQNSKIPVIAHFEGVCHLYVDDQADLAKAKKIIINAKCSRPGVCNALEGLLIHEKLKTFHEEIVHELQERGIQIVGSEGFGIEHLDKKLTVTTVRDLDQAIEFIEQYGSNHTEGILTEDPDRQQRFVQAIDAACVVINTSTRFNDGGELGLGAEIGISTTKLHAYGPMGARELTSSKFVIIGDGQIRP